VRVADASSQFDPETADPDPVARFARWWQEAKAVVPGDDADAMVVATASPSGEPSARYVILRGFDERGFVVHRRDQDDLGPPIDVGQHGDACSEEVTLAGGCEDAAAPHLPRGHVTLDRFDRGPVCAGVGTQAPGPIRVVRIDHVENPVVRTPCRCGCSGV
jgi:hypothetical protein